MEMNEQEEQARELKQEHSDTHVEVRPEVKTPWALLLLVLPLIGVLLLGIVLYAQGNHGWVAWCYVPASLGFAWGMLSATQKLGWGSCMCVLMGCSFLGSSFLFGLDGLFCLVLLAPLLFTVMIFGFFFGRLLGHFYLKAGSRRNLMILCWLLSPLLASWENAGHEHEQPLRAVTSSIEVAASPEQLWPLVVEFPPIESEPDWIFKAGIAQPERAVMEGTGVGAIRRCIFDLGEFTEPVTHWQPPHLLAFRVTHNPVPMKETSIWKDLDPPHLHEMFMSRRGQFKMTRLANGGTRIEGTTWYEHHLWPQWYWGPITDEVIHRIHHRVLEHIKLESEFGK